MGFCTLLLPIVIEKGELKRKGDLDMPGARSKAYRGRVGETLAREGEGGGAETRKTCR
jgi:hypothetical protein